MNQNSFALNPAPNLLILILSLFPANNIVDLLGLPAFSQCFEVSSAICAGSYHQESNIRTVTLNTHSQALELPAATGNPVPSVYHHRPYADSSDSLERNYPFATVLESNTVKNVVNPSQYSSVGNHANIASPASTPANLWGNDGVLFKLDDSGVSCSIMNQKAQAFRACF